MTAIKIIVVTCNGAQGQGCPKASSSRVAADNPTYARQVLADCGWTYIRYTRATGGRITNNVRHYDLCPDCSGRKEDGD